MNLLFSNLHLMMYKQQFIKIPENVSHSKICIWECMNNNHKCISRFLKYAQHCERLCARLKITFVNSTNLKSLFQISLSFLSWQESNEWRTKTTIVKWVETFPKFIFASSKTKIKMQMRVRIWQSRILFRQSQFVFLELTFEQCAQINELTRKEKNA